MKYIQPLDGSRYEIRSDSETILQSGSIEIDENTYNGLVGETLVYSKGLVVAAPTHLTPVSELIAGINAEAQSRIYAKWPIWAQQNCNDGTYPPADKTQMLTDKSIVLTEAKRLTDLIIAGQPAIPAWPVI